ncbi:PadR family transcriptional regulator [Actinophytocola sediminis]
MSATRLLVLGVVRMYGRAHGYQVRRELLSWSADKWANVAPGSIYHALKKMAAENLLEEVAADGEEARGPDRTAYQLTDDGETEFQLLLSKSLTDNDESPQSGYRLAAAVTFLPTLTRSRAISLLRHRITLVRGHETSARNMIEDAADWGQPPHVIELYRLWAINAEALASWLEGLLARLAEGAYVMADDEGTEFGSPASAN